MMHAGTNGGTRANGAGSTWRAEWPHWALLGGMFLLGALTWADAPDSIPVHWGLSGEVDRFGGKLEGLLGPPLLALGLYGLLRYLPRFDPGRANYAQFAPAYGAVRLAVLAVLAGVYGLVHLALRGVEVDVPRAAAVLVGGLLVVLGGALGKVRPNWFVGIRTPWTLTSKRAWGRTHRVGGWQFLLSGLALIAGGLLDAPALLAGSIAVAIGGSLLLIAYSYAVWRADPDRLEGGATLPSWTRPAGADEA